MRSDRTAAALVAAIAAAVYLPALATGFNADDFLILWRIKSVQAAGDPLGYFKFAFYEYFRPLGFLSFALDWRLWQLNAFGFHLTNVALHAANATLVFWLARRLASTTHALVAGLLFALHPASHEAVYWVAARFDLLATFFALAALLMLTRPSGAWRTAGLAAFALALLSKESAIALLVIAPAWDVLIGKKSWRMTAMRLVPLAAVVVLYGAARMVGADLDATGGERRLPKMIMVGAGVAAVLFVAWRREQRAGPARNPLAPAGIGLVAVIVAAVFLFRSEPAALWLIDKITFLRHVVFFSTSPVVFPPPPAETFVPASLGSALGHIAVYAAAAYFAGRAINRGRHRDELLFAVVFFVAALVPVLSMTGGLRYLYLPSAGLFVVVAIVMSQLSRRAHAASLVVIALLLAISTQQIVLAGRTWRTASTVTAEGVRLMAGSIRCGVDDVLILTTPVAVGGVYFNLSWDAFDVLGNCAPKSFMTVLRVVNSDLRASVSFPSPSVAELRVENYGGNIVASADLRNFVHFIARGESRTIDTVAGRLQTYPDGTTQVFRLEMTPDAQAAQRFYYSDGRIRR